MEWLALFSNAKRQPEWQVPSFTQIVPELLHVIPQMLYATQLSAYHFISLIDSLKSKGRRKNIKYVIQTYKIVLKQCARFHFKFIFRLEPDGLLYYFRPVWRLIARTVLLILLRNVNVQLYRNCLDPADEGNVSRIFATYTNNGLLTRS